jgi:hypothetical protein
MRACAAYGSADSARHVFEEPMTPYRCTTGYFDRLFSPCRARLRPLRATAMALLLLVLPIIANTANAAVPAPAAHVYLLRGVLNIFSLGLDEIAAKLRAQGITVTIANYLSWASLADEAAAEYRSGRVQTIVLVGHSSGATALPDMVARLDRLGALENVDVGNSGIRHLTIDKNEMMQQRVISAIDAVVLSRPNSPSVTQKNPGAGAARQRLGTAHAAATTNE